MVDQHEEKYQPLALISIVLIALVGFAVFFLSFLVAPLAILTIFYVGFAASDRSKRTDGGPPPPPGAQEPAHEPENRLTHEAIARRTAIERADEEAGRAATYGPRPPG